MCHCQECQRRTGGVIWANSGHIGWLFDQLVCTSEQLTWYLETKRLCGREIYEELKVGRLYDR
jgi:hypothetical protein